MLVLGVADVQSIGWAIARTLQRAGAHVTLGYQPLFWSRIQKLLKAHPEIEASACDLLHPQELESTFERFRKTGIDGLVHCMAYAPPPLFTQPPSQVHSMDFQEAIEISAHSLAKVVRFARPYLNTRSSIVTLSFQAAQQASPLYGLMGAVKAALESIARSLALELGPLKKIRVNVLSPGPIETLASLSEVLALLREPQAIDHLPPGSLKKIFHEMQQAPLENEFETAQAIWKKIQEDWGRNSLLSEPIHQQDVANAALFLMSPLSQKISGQTLFIDGGFSACL